MPSPFPGMDPYLEARWSDVHAKLIAYIGEAMQPGLPRDLRARSDEQVLLEEVGEDTRPRRYRPDVAVIDVGGGSAASASRATGGAGVATMEPVVIEMRDSPQVERSVHIIDTSNGNRVVTAIEVLSPWNKESGRLNSDYRRKLGDYGRAGVSVVEIDLLRWPTRARLDVLDLDLPPDRRTPYLICVRRGWEPGRWFAYPVSLRTPIPAVHVPLRKTDDPITLRLQPLIERVYVAGGHDDIDYAKPPDPPLTDDDARWAAEHVLRAAAE